MNTPTPAQVASNRTARLVAEYTTPAFVSTPEGAAKRERERLLNAADDCAGEEFCFICSRCTDHRGEHDDEQLLAFAKSPKGQRMMARRLR